MKLGPYAGHRAALRRAAHKTLLYDVICSATVEADMFTASSLLFLSGEMSMAVQQYIIQISQPVKGSLIVTAGQLLYYFSV